MKTLLMSSALVTASLLMTHGPAAAQARTWSNSDNAQQQSDSWRNGRSSEYRQRRERTYERGTPKNYRDQSLEDWSVHYNEQHPYVGPD